MLEKEFIPHTESLVLKELGFDEPCFGMFKVNKLYIDYPRITNNVLKKTNLDNYCTAPTYSQAFKFFREKYNLKSWIEEHTVDTFIYQIRPHKLTDYSDGEIYVYERYEEAELTCLKKLIEIVINEK